MSKVVQGILVEKMFGGVSFGMSSTMHVNTRMRSLGEGSVLPASVVVAFCLDCQTGLARRMLLCCNHNLRLQQCIRVFCTFPQEAYKALKSLIRPLRAL
jgi:hypothetical protein